MFDKRDSLQIISEKMNYLTNIGKSLVNYLEKTSDFEFTACSDIKFRLVKKFT